MFLVVYKLEERFLMTTKKVIEMEKIETSSGEVVFNKKLSAVEELEEIVWQYDQDYQKLKKEQVKKQKIVIFIAIVFIIISLVLFIHFNVHLTA